MSLKNLFQGMALLLSTSSSILQAAPKIFPKSERTLVVERALKENGKPYRWETNGPNSFDCSGFVHFVMREVVGPARFPLPYDLRGTGYVYQSVYYRDYLKQRKAKISCSKAKKGDIVFFPSVPGIPNHIGFITSTSPLTFFTAQSRKTGVRAAGFGKGTYWAGRKPECYSNIWLQ
jgi:cell wall-associated NlpC family hydrolase